MRLTYHYCVAIASFILLLHHNGLGQNCKIPKMDARAVGDEQSCNRLNFGYVLEDYINNDPQTEYTIEFGDGEIITLKHDELDESGTHTITHNYEEVSCETSERFYTFRATAGANCTTFPKVIEISPVVIGRPPKPIFSFDEPACINEPTTFTNGTIDGLNFECTSDAVYRWDFGDGTIIETEEKTSPIHIYKATGTYDVQLTVIQDCGDEVSNPQTIQVQGPPKPVFEIGNTGNVATIDDCPTLPRMFTPLDNCIPLTIPVKSLTSGSGLTESWSITPSSGSGAVFANSGSTNSSESEEEITFSEPGNYTITLTTASNCGTEQSCVAVTVASAPLPQELAIVGIGKNLCTPATLDLSIDVPGATAFDWKITGTSGSTPPALGSANTNNPDPITLSTGTYDIELKLTNACGDVTITETIEVAPPPPARIDQGDVSICAAGTVTLTTADDPIFQYQWQLNGVDLEGATAATVEVTDPGEYTVTVTQGNCSNTSPSVTVTTQLAPEALITSEQAAFCEGEVVSTLLEANTGADLTYQWYQDSKPIAGEVNSSYTATEVGAYTVEVSAGSCVALSDPVIVQVTSPPAPRLSAVDPVVCAGEPLELTMVDGVFRYVWSPADNLSSTEGSTVTATLSADTEFTVTAYTEAGCAKDTTFMVSVTPAPPLSLVASAETVCPGEPVTLTASGADTYEWETESTLVVATDLLTATASPLVTTEYQVVGLSAQGCRILASVTVAVQSIPGVSSSDTAVCVSSGPFALNLELPPGVSGSWSGSGLPTGSITAKGLFDPQVAGISESGHAVTFEYQTTEALACAASISKSVVVNPLPQPEFDIPPVVCVNQPVVLNNTSANDTGVTYRWEVGGVEYTERSPTHQFLQVAEATEVRLVAETRQGCQAFAQKTVQVVAAPEPAFNPVVEPTSLCGPLSVTFTNESQGDNLTYTWDFGNGQTSSKADPGMVTFEPGVLGDTAYVVTLRVNNACTTLEATETVTVRPQPVADFLFERDTICSGYPLPIHNYSTGLAETFEWDFGIDNSPIPLNDRSGTFTQVFTYEGEEDTTYLVTLTATNECGESKITRPLVVTPNQVEAFYNSNITQGCEPLEVTLTSNQRLGTGNQVMFVWGDGDTTQGPVVGSHIYERPGTYYPKIVVQNGCNIDECGGSVAADCGVAIEVYPTPAADFNAPEQICISQEVVLTTTSTNAINSQWDLGNGQTFTGTQPEPFFYDQPGEYIITLVTFNEQGCRSTTKEQLITVAPLPIPAFTASDNAYCATELVQIPNTSTGAATYRWSVKGLGIISTDTNLEYTFSAPGAYELTLEAISGEDCSVATTQTINVSRRTEPEFQYTRSLGCGADSIVFTNLTGYPSSEDGIYEWDFGNGATYSGSSGVPAQLYPYPASGSTAYTVTLTVSSEGCAQIYQQEIEVTARAGVVLPEGSKPLAFTPTARDNNRFRLNYVQVTSIDLRVFSREGVEVFRTTDPTESWDGTYRGELAPAGLYNVLVAYQDCAGGSGSNALQLYLVLENF